MENLSKEKQIEEMAKATMKACKIDNRCGSCHWSTCNECLSEVLYNADYRKSTEVAWEIFEEIERTARAAIILLKFEKDEKIRNAKTECYTDLIGYIAELKKKYESEKDK